MVYIRQLIAAKSTMINALTLSTVNYMDCCLPSALSLTEDESRLLEHCAG